jgi:MYXO-CTERM domain-containing protein
MLDHMCGIVQPEQMISPTTGNDNAGAHMTFAGKVDGVSKFVATSFENGNGGRAWAYGLSVAENVDTGVMELTNPWDNVIYTPTNIARQRVEQIDDERFLYCGPMGNQRPPEDGVYCYVGDTNTGETLSETAVAESKPIEQIYYNQPTIAPLGFDRFAVQVLRSNGEGRQDDAKGTNHIEMYVYEVGSDSTLSLRASLDEVQMVHQTHAAICGGKYGQLDDEVTEGLQSIGIVGASVTGVGQGLMKFVSWSTEGNWKADAKDEWVIAEYADSGLQSNMYGANPGNQGRNFMYCMGDVQNPGYGVEGGFMPEVKSFFVSPMNGKKPDQEKNAQFLAFSPAEFDALSDTCQDLSSPDCNPDGEGPGTEGPETTAPVVPAPEQSSSCSVSAPGSSSGYAGLVLIGLGLAFATRRRNRSEG